MSAPRYTADSITDDALDKLYANASKGWRRGDDWKKRAVAAEAAIARLTAWCDELDANAQALCKDKDSGIVHPVAANIRAKLQPEETSTP
ncbi:hypothetical protein [Streptomyces sp. NPDC096132]|uniref:hypothetical protein n=1 Tax=Streptomyces sp. NPDC096132 TaxID=3366075 RepID=UPI0038286D90